MIIIKIAFRNIFRQKRRSLYTAISIIIGSTLLCVSISLAEGGYGNVIEMFTRGYCGHIRIHQKNYLEKPGIYKNFIYNQDLAKLIDTKLKQSSHAPRIHSGALAFIDKKTTGAKVIGIDPQLERKTTTLFSRLGKGRFFSATNPNSPHNKIVIGNTMARILKAKIGSEIVLISNAADGSIANDIFKVVGIISKENDSTERMNCYMHLHKAQEFLVLPGKVHEIAIVVENYKKTDKALTALNQAIDQSQFSGLAIAPWQKIEEVFYKSMQADKAGNKVMIVIIILIVGLGVLNTVLMSILERTREFGVLKAVGTSPMKIGIMIVCETLILSLFAATIALITGALANWPLVEHGIKYGEKLSVGGIYFDAIYSDWVLEAYVSPFILVVTTAVIVSVIPAIKAMRVKPVEAMRTY